MYCIVPSLPHLAKADIFAGPLRLALGACVSSRMMLGPALCLSIQMLAAQ